MVEGSFKRGARSPQSETYLDLQGSRGGVREAPATLLGGRRRRSEAATLAMRHVERRARLNAGGKFGQLPPCAARRPSARWRSRPDKGRLVPERARLPAPIARAWSSRRAACAPAADDCRGLNSILPPIASPIRTRRSRRRRRAGEAPPISCRLKSLANDSELSASMRSSEPALENLAHPEPR